MQGPSVINLLIRPATIKTLCQSLNLQGLRNAKMTYNLHHDLGLFSIIISHLDDLAPLHGVQGVECSNHSVPTI